MLKKNVLFICIENSCRSQMAQAFLSIYGSDKAQGFSAGSKPSGKINEKAIKTMAELGYDLSKHQSKSLNDIPNISYEYVVSMGCGEACPWVPARHRQDWDIPDPKEMNEADMRKVRDLIAEKVKELLDGMG